MKTYHKTLTVSHPASAIFDVIEDVSQYPVFIKWCRRATILKDAEAAVPYNRRVRLDFALGPVEKHFTTDNTYEKNRSIKMELVEGPFKHLRGAWLLHEQQVDGLTQTKIELHIEFKMANPILTATLGRSFAEITETFIDTFIRRVEALEAAKSTVDNPTGIPAQKLT